MTPPLVSVCVVTYNHELYIERCLRSIVAQQFEFNFEVIVGDDASTDSSPEIIQKIQKEYPNLIFPVLRTSNIGPHKNFIDVFQRARGEFIAYCEGDDYWLDSNKLTLQLSILNASPSVNICFHPAREYREGNFFADICLYGDKSKVVPLTEVILGGGGFMPSASWFIRRSAIVPFPTWFLNQVPVGDNFIQILGAKNAGALYLPNVMSAYHRFNPGSITFRNRSRPWTIDKVNSALEGYKRCYDALVEDIPVCKKALKQCLSSYVFASLTHLLILGCKSEYHVLIERYAVELESLSLSKGFFLTISKSEVGFHACRLFLTLKRWIA